MFRRFTLTIVGAALLPACSQTLPPVEATTTTAAPIRHGTVSAADPRAEEAGMEMLSQGGSSVDAAIATMLALTVVEPQSSGIGGGGFLVRGTPGGVVESFNGREKAPAGADPEWFLNEDGSLPPFGESVRSGLSVGVPGNIALAALAHEKHGKLPWATLFQPAIRLAREGFRVNPRLNNSLSSARDRATLTEDGKALYFDTAGDPLPVGHLVTNEKLAQTFERIAERGPEAFYEGANAAVLAATVSAATPRDGAMTKDDVASYEAQVRAPVCGSYRGYRICGVGPPTSGGIAVLQILGQLERFDLAAMGKESPTAWHLFAESQRLAYADRELYLADADFVAVPVEGLLAREYIARRSSLIDPARSLAEVAPGRPEGAPIALADGDEPEEHGTSHLAVVDADDVMVSYTSTIEGPFGSGLMAGGFFLNNELTDFSRAPIIDGKQVANRVEGGKRPRSSMAPMVVWSPDGKPVLVVGAAGGSTIPVQTARSIIGVIDFGLSAEEALGLPFIMAFGDTLMVEEGTWLEAAIPAFDALGHGKISSRPAPVKGNAILREGEEWIGARDPRLKGQLDLP
ncbi:MAG: gamma-glutamyltransferase [Sphingomonadaceae bacterium]|nr:gamma-glutamyltransferase [Sphingomonadaceae bacterium]MCP5384926.1 gamma-glutamyltransferase [Altererythrobacter sp.]MCP5390479.1 gamma-glutamyltransferase [Sphingomonadaceae bacterium]MCP5392673.1 gamma-glutamyltransferase [Sphingomonadaceae bacterium]